MLTHPCCSVVVVHGVHGEGAGAHGRAGRPGAARAAPGRPDALEEALWIQMGSFSDLVIIQGYLITVTAVVHQLLLLS